MKPTSTKAEQKFKLVLCKVREALSAVSKFSLNSVLAENKRADLNDFSVRNRTPLRPTEEKNIMFDVASNALKTKADSKKKDTICGLNGCLRTFTVLMQYGIAINPDLAISLSKYLDHFCTLADPRRKCSFGQLLDDHEHFLVIYGKKLFGSQNSVS